MMDKILLQDGYYKDPPISFTERPSVVNDPWEISPDSILLGKELWQWIFR